MNEIKVTGKQISIHTTTQVVTRQMTRKQSEPLNFNPHHHAGGDSG